MRTFSGESECGREYRRWKTWVLNKMVTMDKLAESSRGAFIMTLLTGKAYEAVEHLEFTEYHKKDGDALIWNLLDARFPKLEVVDELAETLNEVFTLRAKEGETMKQWTARATELFDRCSRKTSVSFPEEARGWILLNRSMLTDEQRAVVVSRSRGDLKRESIASALRSCYPDLVIRKRGVAYVEEALAVQGPREDEIEDDDTDFDDVCQFLADHNVEPEIQDTGETFHEDDVAEVLAASWKDRRQELNKLQKSRQFQKAKDVRRSFRVEIEELKKQTTCNRCGRKGHWARECKAPASKGSGKSTTPSSTSGAAVVQDEPDFVAMAELHLTMIEKLRQKQANVSPSTDPAEVMLISSPGFGVLDSGCGRTIIGRDTLEEFQQLWEQQGVVIPPLVNETHQFRFGNGHVETSSHSICLPVWIAGKRGVIRAAVVNGAAPLLISRSALKALRASLDFQHDRLQIFDGISIPLKCNSAGQYVINLMDRNVKDEQQVSGFSEVMLTEIKTNVDEVPYEPAADPNDGSTSSEESSDSPLHEANPDSAAMPSCWVQDNCGSQTIPWVSRDGPAWSTVCKRVVIDGITKRVLASHDFHNHANQRATLHPLPANSGCVITKFFFHVDPRIESHDATSMIDTSWRPSVKQSRQLSSQVKSCHEALLSQVRVSPCLVQEVFSPPRFVPSAEAVGMQGFSYDLKTGYDLSTAADRKRVEDALEKSPPELLVLSPPCTDEGGWFHLNSTRWDRMEYLRRVARSRSYIRWCCKLFRAQAARGKRAMFEHPTGAKTWTYPEVQSLCRQFYTCKLHMCRYGLRLPGSESCIRKSTRLLLTHEDMQSLSKLCPGTGEHSKHDVVAGSWQGVPSVSQFAGQYPPEFVEAVLRTVPMYRDARPSEVMVVVDDTVPPEQWDSVLAVTSLSEKTDEELLPIIKKLHQNLGHPPNHDLIRVLKHGQASEQALRLAKDFSCDFCKTQCRPSVALPAQPRRISEVNQLVGLDIKYLKGWRPNQKVKALNLVDYASGYQRVIPFFEQETAQLIRKMLEEHWISWLGPPRELILDAARTNLGENMATPSELQGTEIRPIAAGAHWQLGKVESHGGWFGRLVEKLVDAHQPSNKEDWLQCVVHAHIKNQMLQVHGFSPHQMLFGRNPNIPEDLLSEPLNVIAATASLTEQGIARAQAMRTTARSALIQMQDDRALRVALLARPRVSREFAPGDLVAYWRDQKWIKGKLQIGGQWWGTAVVLGKVGRNYVLLHRRQVLRCAPEQIRPATTEEKTVLGTPHAEMLGIKDLIEQGNIRSQQFLDLLPQSYPPEESPQPDQPPTVVDDDMKESAPVRAPESRSNSTVTAPEASDLRPAGSAPQPELPESEMPQTGSSEAPPEPKDPIESNTGDSSYGPIRRRVTGKDGPLSLWRPAAMRQDDFVEIMKELVPPLIEQAMDASGESSGVKRPVDEVESARAGEPAPARPRIEEALSVVECNQLCDSLQNEPHEIFMAEFLKKKMSKRVAPQQESAIASGQG